MQPIKKSRNPEINSINYQGITQLHEIQISIWIPDEGAWDWLKSFFEIWIQLHFWSFSVHWSTGGENKPWIMNYCGIATFGLLKMNWWQWKWNALVPWTECSRDSGVGAWVIESNCWWFMFYSRFNSRTNVGKIIRKCSRYGTTPEMRYNYRGGGSRH